MPACISGASLSIWKTSERSAPVAKADRDQVSAFPPDLRQSAAGYPAAIGLPRRVPLQMRPGYGLRPAQNIPAHPVGSPDHEDHRERETEEPDGP